MAKRKRLEVPTETVPTDAETKSTFHTPRSRMPIADVAGEVAGRAALEEIAREMTTAEEEGRVVKKLPLDRIVSHHLARDRIVLDEEEMAALIASLEARGQQTPVEVVRIPNGDFGLISGLRRIEALKQLGQTHVLGIVRQPETSQGAYQAMVEENEIRANLSFYERAQIAVSAAGQGVYPDPKAAVQALFAHAPSAKRSKIFKFVTICLSLGDKLNFPTAIPEKLGLALAHALEADPILNMRLSDALRKTPPVDAAAERRTLERALKKQAPPTPNAAKVGIAPGLMLEARAGRAVLSGPALDEAFLEALQEFAVSHAKSRT